MAEVRAETPELHLLGGGGPSSPQPAGPGSLGTEERGRGARGVHGAGSKAWQQQRQPSRGWCWVLGGLFSSCFRGDLMAPSRQL